MTLCLGPQSTFLTDQRKPNSVWNEWGLLSRAPQSEAWSIRQGGHVLVPGLASHTLHHHPVTDVCSHLTEEVIEDRLGSLSKAAHPGARQS